jgi:hypothetical protein
MTTAEPTPPSFPEFTPGEMKKIGLGFREVDGKIEIAVTSQNLNDDINQIAVLLAFALEKMLEE